MFFSVINKNLNWETFYIIEAPWKIWVLRGGGSQKPNLLKKGGLGQFADLRRNLVKNRVLVFLREAWYANAHYDDKSVLWIFPKMPSEIFCSKICRRSSAKASFMYQHMNCYYTYIYF